MWIFIALLSLSTFAREVIVYTSLVPQVDKIEPNSEIYLMDLKSSKPQRLTNHPAFDFEPTLHPSGKLVAYVTDRFKNSTFGDEQIMLKDLSSGKEERLDIGFRMMAHKPKFSHDGKYLYFSRAPIPDGSHSMDSYRIMRYDLEIKELGQVSPDVLGNVFDLAPSPDGKRLAFRYAADGYQFVRVLDLATGISEELFPGRPDRYSEMSPAWKNNQELTIITDYGEHEDLQRALFLVPLTTKAGIQLPTHQLIYDFHQLCWFNADKAVMAAAEVDSGSVQLFVMKGNDLKKISLPEVHWSGEPDCRIIK